MLEIIKKLLLKIVNDINVGNSNITEEKAINIIDALKNFTDKTQRLSKYQTCEYLNISRATFDNLVKSGRIPKGRKTIDFKELFWNKKDLDLLIRKIK